MNAYLTTLVNASTTQISVSNTAYFPGSGIWNSSGNAASDDGIGGEIYRIGYIVSILVVLEDTANQNFVAGRSDGYVFSIAGYYTIS